MMAGKKPNKLTDKVRKNINDGLDKAMPARKKLLEALDVKKKK